MLYTGSNVSSAGLTSPYSVPPPPSNAAPHPYNTLPAAPQPQVNKSLVSI